MQALYTTSLSSPEVSPSNRSANITFITLGCASQPNKTLSSCTCAHTLSRFGTNAGVAVMADVVYAVLSVRLCGFSSVCLGFGFSDIRCLFLGL